MKEMTLLNMLNAVVRIDGLGGNTMSEQPIDSGTIRYVGGVPRESQALVRDMPPYFFIIWVWLGFAQYSYYQL